MDALGEYQRIICVGISHVAVHFVRLQKCQVGIWRGDEEQSNNENDDVAEKRTHYILVRILFGYYFRRLGRGRRRRWHRASDIYAFMVVLMGQCVRACRRCRFKHLIFPFVHSFMHLFLVRINFHFISCDFFYDDFDFS